MRRRKRNQFDSKVENFLEGRRGLKWPPRIGATYARTFLESRLPENTYFADTRLHLHVPEGATPKVGGK